MEMGHLKIFYFFFYFFFFCLKKIILSGRPLRGSCAELVFISLIHCLFWSKR